MKVRISTKAGLHELGVTFLQTNLAPILDLDQHFMRNTVRTGHTPGFTYFRHVGTVRIEGPFNAKQAEDSPSRRKIFICRPAGATDESFFFQAEDGIRDVAVTGVQTCALPI